MTENLGPSIVDTTGGDGGAARRVRVRPALFPAAQGAAPAREGCPRRGWGLFYVWGAGVPGLVAGAARVAKWLPLGDS